MEVTMISISGWTVKAILINKITNNQLVFYAQNRLAIYNTDTKEAIILAEYIVIPEYDNLLKQTKDENK